MAGFDTKITGNAGEPIQVWRANANSIWTIKTGKFALSLLARLQSKGHCRDMHTICMSNSD
eukprot:9219193-Prorocentrum_lima.AAC.1